MQIESPHPHSPHPQAPQPQAPLAGDASPPAAVGVTLESRWRPALAHLLLGSLLVGLATFGLVRLWYPQPYATLAGGLELLWLLIAVDIVLGPALTFVAASPGKLRRIFLRDLAVIVALQAAAAGYGMYTLSVARPVGIAFEVDQMRLIVAADVPAYMLGEAPPELRALPWSGPRLMAAVKPSDPQELLRAIELGMSGVELSMLPKQWRSYASVREAVLTRSLPIELLLARHPQAKPAVQELAQAGGARLEELRFLPLRTRRFEGWISLVAAPDARLLGHLDPAVLP